VVTFYANFIRVRGVVIRYGSAGNGLSRARREECAQGRSAGPGHWGGGDDTRFQIHFETVACLGACALSPVLLVNKNYYGKLTPAKVEQVLKQYV